MKTPMDTPPLEESKISIERAYELWSQDDSPVISFSECLICKEEGYSGQRGHSTQSCLADKLKEEQ